MKRLATIVTILAVSCINPATGRRNLILMTEGQEIQAGREGAKGMVEQLGLVESQPLKDLVTKMGSTMSASTERPNLPWTFFTVDDPVVNAFAMPGGYVFVTRGLLAHLNSEAELAAVIGHEVGHVTARHSAQQMSMAQLAQGALGVGGMLSETIAGYSQIAAQGLQLVFMKFGRDDEAEADKLGYRYALSKDYDMREMPKVFETLGRVSAAAGAGELPEWLSTHPNPVNRESAAEDRIKASTTTDWAKTRIAHDEFVKMLDGLPFGADPRKGFLKNTTFLLPAEKLQVAFPQGWSAQHGAVTAAQNLAGDAAIQLERAGTQSPEQIVRTLSSKEGVKAGVMATGKLRDTIPFARATFEAPGEKGPVKGEVFGFLWQGKGWSITALSSATTYEANKAAFEAVFQSVDELKDPAVLALRPMSLKIEKTDAEMTLTEFNTKNPSAVPVETIALINALNVGDKIPAGALVKRVLK